MKPRVVIAGGGIAGMEAALALADLAGDLAEITLVAPDPEFLYKPLTVEEPFTMQPAERHDLAPALATIGVEFVEDAVVAVDHEAGALALSKGGQVPFDRLVVCVGGKTRDAFEGVETFWSHRSDLPVDEIIRRAHASEARTLSLLIPPATTWSLPMYELALQIRSRSEALGMADLELRLVTPEDSPLAVFGTTAAEAVAELLRVRRITVEAKRYVVQEGDGELRPAPSGEPIDPQMTIALPLITGPKLEGLPADPEGFIPIDGACRVRGLDRVFAAGDGTNFPVKQGGLATQQADVAAEQIAAGLGADVQPRAFEPVLRGQLVTGTESLNLKHDLAGGHGDGVASLDYLWWPPQKVAGRYLAAWLGHTEPTDLEPPSRPIEVEVAWPHEWHGEPMTYDAEHPRDV